MRVSPHFILPRPRSTGFRHGYRDFRHFHTASLAHSLRGPPPLPEKRWISDVMSGLRMYWFPYAYPVEPVRLATMASSLANVSGLMKQS